MIVVGSVIWFSNEYERGEGFLDVGRYIKYIFDNALIAGGRILNHVLDEGLVVKRGGCEFLVFIVIVVQSQSYMLIQKCVVQ